MPRTRVTFVLGGGGGPGMAFHCGALKAIEDETGIRLADADLAIGTSAGSVVASRLASGHTLDEVMLPPSEPEPGAPKSVLVPRWGSRIGLARNALGAGFAVSRNIARLPASRFLLAPIERVFPPGMFAVRGWESAGLAEEWPEMPLWLVTMNTNTNRRVVLHRLDDSTRQAPLQQAVAASCAVPGVFMPERIGRHVLVDGGVHSSANVDLAARARSEVVFALAPMSYDPSFPISRRRAAPRAALNAQLKRELRIVSRAGGQTLLLRPSGDDLAARRGGLFSQSQASVIAERAYETTLVQLRRPYAQDLVLRAQELLAETVGRPTAVSGS